VAKTAKASKEAKIAEVGADIELLTKQIWMLVWGKHFFQTCIKIDVLFKKMENDLVASKCKPVFLSA
jgi:hypothetical protein